jgi:hypothetical protein
MPPRPGPRKYDPLTWYLASLVMDEVTLVLAEIEAIIGVPLPASAERASFWANMGSAWGGSSQAQAWRRAGWRVERTDLPRDPPAVTFVRVPR